MKLSILMVDSGLPFSGSQNMAKQSLGGSETACYYMAKHLAALGHEVRVVNFCTQREKADGVMYYPYDNLQVLLRTLEPDVFISSRAAEILTLRNRAKMTVSWHHDIAPPDIEDFTKHLWAVDKVFLLSEYQKSLYNRTDQGLPPDWLSPHCHVTRNGIDLDLINKFSRSVVKKPNRFIYASRPERGLQRLLTDIWPSMVEQDSSIELALCSYTMDNDRVSENVKLFYEMVNDLIGKTSNIEVLGALPKGKFYKELAASQALLYPCHFPEISCIAVMESLACGTPVVTTKGFALPETLQDAGILIDGMPSEESYQKAFIAETFALLDDKEKYAELVLKGKDRAAQLDWVGVAEEWSSYFINFFEGRFQHNKKEIVYQLIEDSDMVAANKLCQTYPEELNEELQLTNLFLGNQYDNPDRYSEIEDPDVCLNQWAEISRFPEAFKKADGETKSMLDVGCGVGMALAWGQKLLPKLQRMVGLDFSPNLIQVAREFVLKHCERPGIVDLVNLPLSAYESDPFDLVTCFETLEHIIDTKGTLEHLERLCRPGGTIILTLPYGPWELDSDWQQSKKTHRYHCHHFTAQDLTDILGTRNYFDVSFLPAQQMSARGSFLGWWVVSWIKDAKRPDIGKVQYEAKWKTTRPYQFISGAMIVKDEEDWISGAIKSVTPIIDELIVYDTGSTDSTKDIVEAMAQRYARPEIKWVQGDPITQTTGFAGVRNKSLECCSPRASWYLWFDADERLVRGGNLRRALDSKVYPGYVITQSHLMLDLKAAPDTPVRIFRRDTGAKFQGIIHEHPESQMNEPLEPMLQLPHITFAHYGYLTEQIRREKCAVRNMPLLLADRANNPDRKVGLILLARDYLHLAEWQMEKTRGMQADSLRYLRAVCSIYWDKYRDLESSRTEKKYWVHCFSFYQAALRWLGKSGERAFEDNPQSIPFEVAEFQAGGQGGLSSDLRNIQPVRRWFSTREEYIEWGQRQVIELSEQMETRLVGELPSPREAA